MLVKNESRSAAAADGRIGCRENFDDACCVPDEERFQPSPIEASCVLEGNPVARSFLLFVSNDRLFSCARWHCTAGRIKFVYTCDEFVEITEGSVTIETDGQTRTLHPGDLAFFSQGSTAIWLVHGHVKKLAVFRAKRPGLIGRIRRKLGAIFRSAPLS